MADYFLIGLVFGLFGISLGFILDEWQTSRRVRRFWREWEREYPYGS